MLAPSREELATEGCADIPLGLHEPLVTAHTPNPAQSSLVAL